MKDQFVADLRNTFRELDLGKTDANDTVEATEKRAFQFYTKVQELKSRHPPILLNWYKITTLFFERMQRYNSLHYNDTAQEE
jgi:hypothetical protein